MSVRSSLHTNTGRFSHKGLSLFPHIHMRSLQEWVLFPCCGPRLSLLLQLRNSRRSSFAYLFCPTALSRCWILLWPGASQISRQNNNRVPSPASHCLYSLPPPPFSHH